MRIQCFSLDEFLQNLDEGEIHRRVVYVGRVLQKDGVVTSVVMQCSAVVIYSDDTQALVECGFFCGKDIDTADGGPEGSMTFDEYRGKLEEFCMTKGLRLLPGIIDM